MQRQSFNRQWRFELQGEPYDAWKQLNPAGWRELDLPHDWSIELPRSAQAPSQGAGGYFHNGRGVYAKRFSAPQDWRGKKVLLEFEGVYMNAEVRLNEHHLTRHPYGYTSFLVDLSAALRYGEENELRVTVDNAAEPNSRWYAGSGIYRPVYLIVANPLHVQHWGVWVTTPQVSAEQALVRMQTRAINEGPQACPAQLRWRILGPDGSPAAQGEAQAELAAGAEHAFQTEVAVCAPCLWSLEQPHLYRLESELLSGGQVVDCETTSFGIRSLEFDPQQGFRLNGQPVLLKGGCVHHDHGVLGSVSYPRAEERKVELHLASGFNAIRCAHNPPAPAFLEACDRLGMLVVDEAFDCWREGKNPYDYHTVFEDWWQRDLDSMVLRDRNHPCVIMWSIGNEVHERDGRANGAQIAAMLARRVRELDPTRPITSAICGIWGTEGGHVWADTDAVFAALDVGGYNYQWANYRPDHVRHPQRMMIGTESFPLEALENWELVEAEPYVLGDFVWTSLDYLGEAGIGRTRSDGLQAPFLGAYPWHQANCGDLDLCGFKRPQSYYRDMVWGTGAPLYLAVHQPSSSAQAETPTPWGWPVMWPSWNWPGREAQALEVEVYSTCESVELWLNGRSLGVQPAGKVQRYRAHFNVPYEPGVLKAVGLRAGQPAAETALETAGEPAGLRLTPDHTRLQGADDLAYVTVEIVDAAGRVHPAADRPVTFSLEGPGSILAVGSADPTSEEPYRGNRRTPFHGRALVVVKANAAGTLRLCATAEGLAAGEVTLPVD